ncbi:MAG: hypothetical protein HFG76_16575, partial [Hungatella sp.]|nr:hypothetical protein [Hungatella sp.]
MWNRKRILSMALGMAVAASSLTPALPSYGAVTGKDQRDNPGSGSGGKELAPALNVLRDREEIPKDQEEMEELGSYYVPGKRTEPASVSNALRAARTEGTHLAVFAGQVPEIETEKPLDPRDFEEPYSTVEVTAKDGTKYLVEVVPEGIKYFVDSGAGETSPAYEAVKALTGGLLNHKADEIWTEGDLWGRTDNISQKSETDIKDKTDTGIYGNKNSANNPISYKFTLEPGSYTITSSHKEWWSQDRPMAMEVSYGDKKLSAGSVTVSGGNTTAVNKFSFTLDEEQTITYTINNTGSQAPAVSWVAVAQMDLASLPLEDRGEVTVRKGASLDEDLGEGKMISVNENWISGGDSAAESGGNAGGGIINDGTAYFKKKEFTLYTDFFFNEDSGDDDKTSALLIGNRENYIRLIPRTTKKEAILRVHTGGGDTDHKLSKEIALKSWHGVGIMYSEEGDRGKISLCLDGEQVLSPVDMGFLFSGQDAITAGYGITYGTGFMRRGKYDNIVVSHTMDDLEDVKAETKARAAEKNKLASQAPRIVIDGAEVEKAGENKNGLTFKGFGVLDCNSTNALLLDYKVQHPEKYWEMLEKLFGGEHPIVQHIKIEMGNDKNTSTGPQACTMRTSDEYPNVARVTGFQLAADAKKINPNVKVSLLYWCAPGWVGDKSNWDGVYKWLKNTAIAAYREYGYMIDIVSPGVNENKDDPNWIKEFKKRVRTDEAGMISNDAQVAGFREGEQELFQKIQVLMSDEVGIASCGPEIMNDPELMEAVDIVGYHYNPYDDSQGNFKKLAEQYDKEIWNSEAQATFGSTADRPNNNMKEQDNTAGTGIGGNGGPLEMADTAIKGFVNSRRTHFVYQPTFGAFYEGCQYNYKDVMSARDPWSGYVNYDAALNIFQHFTKFAVTGWEDDDPGTPQVWRGIPGASKSEASGSNPVNGRNGGDNYLTLAAPDKTGFSVIITNDCSKTKTYSICPRNMNLAEGAQLEVWETRAADEGQVYSANYMKCVDTLSANEDGCYDVTVKPWSIVTVTTMDMDQRQAELALPTAAEDGRFVLDTDETGKVQDTADTWLYADDFNYQGILVKDYRDGELVDSGDTFIETRGGAKGFYPLYTHDVNGSFEVVMNKAGTDGVLKMNGQTGGGWWNGGEPATIIGDYRWTNYKASVDFNLDSVKEHLLLGVRQRGAAGGGDNKVSMSAYNLALNREGDWVARRYGNEISKGKVKIKNTAACNVAVQAAGDTVTFYIEGEPVYTYRDPSPQLEGRVMLGVGLPGESWSPGEFDNLKVETVPGYSPYYAGVYDNLHMKKWDGDEAGQDALVYEGEWNHQNQSSSSHSQRSMSSTSQVGASVSYTFEGTGFALIGPNGGSAKVDVEVDGRKIDTDAPTIATSSHQPYFVVRGLKNGQHTVTVSLASGTLDVDSFAYIKANEQVSQSVNTEALGQILDEIDNLKESDYYGESWTNFQTIITESGRFTRETAEEMNSDPRTYGADQEGIDEAAAYLRAELNKLVSADAPVEILNREILPEILAVPQGGTVEDLAGGQLPAVVKVKKADSTEGEAEIAWELSGDISQIYSTAEAVGTVIGGKDPETGEALRVTVPVEVTSPEIVYFIDPGTDDTRVYDLYKATCPELKNETNDKIYQSGSWGRGEANIKGNTNPMDKLDTGLYSGRDIVYTLPLEAGLYILTAGFTEWWGYGRDMSQTISYTLQDGTEKTLSGSNISFGAKGNMISSTAFIVAEDTTVTYTLKKTKNQDSVLSWLGVTRMADMDDPSWAPVFESDESNQWAGLLTYGTVTQKEDPDQGQVLHMNGAGTTYAQFDPEAIDFTSRENMTLSFDLKSETADGNFFTVAIGQDSDKYFFLRTRKDSTYTAITTGSWGAEQKKESDADTYNKWVHMDLVFSPEQIITYIDGVPQVILDKTILMTNFGKNPVVYLGRSFYSGDKYFAGAFDNIKVYNRSRERQELALSYEIAKAEKLENLGFSPDSWNNFMTALDEARAAAGDGTLTEDQREAAKDALLAAIGALETDLVEMVKRGEELNEADYTADSWAGFGAALAEAKEVLANPAATQEEKDRAKDKLQAAMEALVKVSPEVKVDVTGLRAAIEEAEELKAEDYTAESWKGLEDALKAAKAVLATEGATQKQVDEAEKALREACEKLEKKAPEEPGVKVDVTGLRAAIEEAEALKAEDYTAESWKAVEDALKAAKAVLATEGATQ